MYYDSQMVASSGMMQNFPDVQQKDHYSCGAAASMACGLWLGVGPGAGDLNLFERSPKQAKILEEWKSNLGTDVEESTDPQSIVNYFLKLGLFVLPKQSMSIWDLRDFVSYRNVPIICPVQDYGNRKAVKAKFDYGHYIVVIGVIDGYIVCQDSSEDNVIAGSDSIQKPGRVIISYKDWQAVWHDEDKDGNQYFRYGIALSQEPL